MRLSLPVSLRNLLRRPRFTVPAVLTLATGLAAATAVFTLVDTTLLRPLPYPGSERIVGFWGQGSWSAAELDFVREHARSYESVGAFTTTDVTFRAREPRALPAAVLSPDALQALAASPALGRPFRLEEEEKGQGRVVLVSDDFWRAELGADPDVLGREIELDEISHEIIGVMPPGFAFPRPGVELWLPLTIDRDRADYRYAFYLGLLGRLGPGSSVADANAELQTLVPALTEALELEPGFDKLATVPYVEPLRHQLTRSARAPLFLLLGASGLLLIIACVNVAHLLLAQAVTREKELAIRGALGASRLALVRQLLGEAGLVGVAGGGLALLLAVWTVDLLRSALPATTPRLEHMVVDGRIFAFGALIAGTTVLIFGLLPALYSSRSDLRRAMSEGSQGAGSRRSRTRFLLVTAEMALAALLTVVAVSNARSFLTLAAEDPGFEPRGVVTLRPELVGKAWAEREKIVDYYQQAALTLEAQPGIRRAGAIWRLPIAEGGAYQKLEIEGREQASGEAPFAYWRATAGRYFESMQISLLRGRDFTAGDRADSAPVGLINAAMAASFWPDGDALGKRFRSSADGDGWVTIVGIVDDVRHESLRTPAHFTIYRPFAQAPNWVRGMALVARTEGDVSLPALRASLAGLAPGVAVHRLATYEELMADSIARERLTGSVVSAYGTLAVMLASIGVFGLLSFSVGERRREIGIRMALGARRGSILGRVLAEGMAPVAAGIAAGLSAALAGSRFLDTVLYEVRADDPVTFIAASATLAVVALAACWLPADRAAALEPVKVLRED